MFFYLCHLQLEFSLSFPHLMLRRLRSKLSLKSSTTQRIINRVSFRNIAGSSTTMTKKMLFEHSLTINEVLFYSAGYAEAIIFVKESCQCSFTLIRTVKNICRLFFIKSPSSTHTSSSTRNRIHHISCRNSV